ncbi:hypothetical protein [Nocardiopsis sp. CNT312]|uniref:hypothetical protein n=1 Tax=Nocardiopsis sp. CNT312 TaxID=1137268 RepID=UPI00049095CB|nr:hypothetical protein [Nocardiopsis sp. CNT312]
MATGTYEWQSDFARKYVGQGREEGQVLAKRDMLLRLLERRHIPVNARGRSRIDSCNDLDRFDLWFDHAVTATTSDELFD